jgi:hypothetical protein
MNTPSKNGLNFLHKRPKHFKKDKKDKENFPHTHIFLKELKHKKGYFSKSRRKVLFFIFHKKN